MTTGSTSIVAEAPGAAFTQGSVTADGFTVRYFEAGTGSPIVVLHGAGGPRFTVALDLLTGCNGWYGTKVPLTVWLPEICIAGESSKRIVSRVAKRFGS